MQAERDREQTEKHRRIEEIGQACVHWMRFSGPVKSAALLMPDATCELPYAGAKEMLPVDQVDSKAFLRELFEAMNGELSDLKKKKNGKANFIA